MLGVWLAAAGWPDVFIALVAASPGLLSAVLIYLTRRDMRPPSGGTIGEVMEFTKDTAIANNLRLRGQDDRAERRDEAFR